MNLVDNHAAEAREHPWRIFIGGQKRERLGRRQKDVRGIDPLALFAGGAGVAGSVFNPDRQAHLADRHVEVSSDIRGEGLEGRDIERVQPLARLVCEFRESWQKARQRLAAARGCDEHERGLARAIQHFPLVRMHLPAAGGEPVGKGEGQGGHAPKLTQRAAESSPEAGQAGASR